MGPLGDIRLSRAGALILAAVSLAATILILSGGATKTDAQLAAQAALKHPPHTVDEITASGNSGQSAGSGGGGSSASGSAVGSGAPSREGAAVPSSSGASNSGGGGSSHSSSSASSGSSSGSGGSGNSNASGNANANPSGQTTTSATTTTTTTAADAGLPKVGHVFLITLSTRDYQAAFGAKSAVPYLRALARRGTVLTGFHAVASNGLADLLAMVSGQPPNRDTAAGCPKYVPFAASATVKASGLALGAGCIYPDAALTVADLANAAGETWGAYVADMGPNNCSVPASGAPLETPLDGTQEGYDVAHNPFAFFGSLLDAGGCSEYDQDLTNLPAALAKQSLTPNFTYVGSDACVDAAPVLAPAASTTTTTTTTTPVAATTTATSTTPARLIAPAAYGCPSGQTSGMAAENAFLRTWVPKILASAAYQANGVLVIAFTGAGGKPKADTGALVISHWTPKGKQIATAYTPYSLLRSIDDMLDLTSLADAATAPSFARLVLH